MTVLKMGFVKILSWISVVHRNDQNMSENGIRTYNLSSECLWSINYLATRKNLETKFSQSHCNVAQVKHHEQVVVGGHLAALASSGEVNFIEKFSEINNTGPISEIKIETAKYFDFLLIISFKILFQIWNLWGNLLATSRGPYTVSAIFSQPWQVSLNGLGTPYIGDVAKTDSNLKT